MLRLTTAVLSASIVLADEAVSNYEIRLNQNFVQQVLANNIKPIFDHIESMSPETATLDDLENV